MARWQSFRTALYFHGGFGELIYAAVAPQRPQTLFDDVKRLRPSAVLWPQVAAQPLKEDSSEERRTERKYSHGRKATASWARERRWVQITIEPLIFLPL